MQGKNRIGSGGKSGALGYGRRDIRVSLTAPKNGLLPLVFSQDAENRAAVTLNSAGFDMNSHVDTL